MALRISAEQRDALYSRALDQLRAFDDLLHAVDADDTETAYRLGRRMTDSLLFIQEELGWGQHVSGERELRRIPPDQLLRILGRVRDDAALQHENQLPELEEVREPVEETALIRDTCGELVDALRRET